MAKGNSPASKQNRALVSSPSYMAETRSEVIKALSVSPVSPDKFDFGEKQLRSYTGSYEFIKDQQRQLTEAFNTVAKVEGYRGKVSRDEFRKIMNDNDYMTAYKRMQVILSGESIKHRYDSMQRVIADSKKSKF